MLILVQSDYKLVRHVGCSVSLKKSRGLATPAPMQAQHFETGQIVHVRKHARLALGLHALRCDLKAERKTRPLHFTSAVLQ